MEKSMEAFEYAIRKDVRNNPIVREVDERRQRELWQSMAIGGVLVLVLLFSAWQHFELLRHGYRLEQMQRERATESEINRHLRLEIETLRAPQRIEKLATERLGMVAPGDRRRVVLERGDAAAGQVARRADAASVVRDADVAEPPIQLASTVRSAPAGRPADASRCGRRHRGAARLPAGHQHDELVARAERQQMSTRSPAPAKRGEILDRRAPARLQRRRRHHLRGPDRDRRSRRTARAVRRSTTARRRIATSWSSGWPGNRAFAYVKRAVSPAEQAKRVAASISTASAS